MGTDMGRAGETERLMEAFCLLETPDEAHAFLLDLLSKREIQDLASSRTAASRRPTP